MGCTACTEPQCLYKSVLEYYRCALKQVAVNKHTTGKYNNKTELIVILWSIIK